ncbi:hypothetical protein E0504_41205 [Parafrankia sp. BMG5.11]|nr:hypothetical protein E0504_41205 [Parafrankia sp. BMG5.11]
MGREFGHVVHHDLLRVAGHLDGGVEQWIRSRSRVRVRLDLSALAGRVQRRRAVSRSMRDSFSGLRTA